MGNNLISTELEFDYNAFAAGMKDVMETGKGQFSEMEAIEIVETALIITMERRTEEHRIREAEFLTINMGRPGVITTPSGLQYEILADSEGDRPKDSSVVRVNYEGFFMDGTMFDSSDEEDGAYIPLDMVIPGWAEALKLMPVGGKYRFFIPSSMAYGREGIQQIIPPYSTLIFNVELLEIIFDEYEYEDE